MENARRQTTLQYGKYTDIYAPNGEGSGWRSIELPTGLLTQVCLYICDTGIIKNAHDPRFESTLPTQRPARPGWEQFDGAVSDICPSIPRFREGGKVKEE